jgi:poly(A) polymerase
VSKQEDAPKPLAYRLGTDTALDVLLLSDRDIAEVEQVKSWQAPRLPLSGGALVARGLAKGPDVARALRAVEDRWVAEGFPSEERVDALADEAVAQALRAASKA